MPNTPRLWIATVVTVSALALTGCGSSSADEVGAEVGGTCEETGWEQTNALTDERALIYACEIDGDTKCVTYDGGVARDVTEWTQREFEDALSDARPSCVA
jgi:hypothetical protein